MKNLTDNLCPMADKPIHDGLQKTCPLCGGRLLTICDFVTQTSGTVMISKEVCQDRKTTGCAP